jgi:hypothetical protein
MIRFKMRHGCGRIVGGMKITPEMVAAGAEMLPGREWPYENGDEVAQDVFIAMVQAAEANRPIARLSPEFLSAWRKAREPLLSRTQFPQAQSGAWFLVDLKV